MPGGEWSTPAAVIEVDQLPMFYQRSSFLLLMALACGGILAAIFLWRVHVIRSRYALIAAERTRIAREWHDTLVAGFSAISWQLEETLSQIRTVPDSAVETIKLALKMVHHYRAEARSVIWDLREKRDESETLGDAIAAVLGRVAGGSGIQSTVEVAGTFGRLPQDLERNLLRICHEAGSNAKQHGRATHIVVSLAYRKDSLCLRVEDDGQGFEPRTAVDTARGHFGMAVMRERAERFGGELHVVSRPGNGTIVEALIPLAHMAPDA
jgi:signal transduction histidine kinase